jgi:hypothetical protein
MKIKYVTQIQNNKVLTSGIFGKSYKYSDDTELAEIVDKLINEGFCFVDEPAGWPPATVLKTLQGKKLLNKSFTAITWSGPGQYRMYQVEVKQKDTVMNLSSSFSGALRTFAYFMSSGTHYMLKGIDYLSLYGKEPSAIEQVYAIFANVIQLDEDGQVLNATYAQKRSTDYLREYCDPSFTVDPPYEDWEIALYEPPPLKDLK